MREIKFRAWESNKMSGSFTIFDISDDNGRTYLNDFGRIYDPILMQYTGLKDKNGKEIYEGDILATSNDGKDGCDEWDEYIIGEVVWENEYSCFTGVPDRDEESIESATYAYVKGNIYENPELLK